jgi:molecular chaperone DnaK
MKLGEAMYKAQAESAAAAPEAPEAGPNGEKIVDAEFEEVDDKKKSA